MEKQNETVRLLRQKDPDGVKQLITHYSPLIKYIVSPILSDRHDIEECISEITATVWEKIDSFDEKKGSWNAWLTSVSRNAALNKLRKNGQDKANAELTDDIPSDGITPEEEILRREQMQALTEAMNRLPQRDKTLFFRKYYYMQPTSQIAAETGMTERAVEGKLYRIKKKLRVFLGGDNDE